MRRLHTLFVLAAAMLLALLPSARAIQYQLDYTGNDPTLGTFTLSALLTATDPLVSVGPFMGHQITGITGIRSDTAGPLSIDGLLGSDPMFILDNMLVSSPVLGFDNAGLGFTVGALRYNLYSVGDIYAGPSTYYESLADAGGARYNPGDVVDRVTISQIPDTASTFALFGLGLIGLVGARRFMGRQEFTLPAPI